MKTTVTRKQFIRQLAILGGSMGASSWGLGSSFDRCSHRNTYTAPIRLLVDADTANEVDDLYAIVRALLEPRFDIRGLTAAQWHTSPVAPNDTVGLSHKLNEDILRLMDLSQVPHHQGANVPLVNTVRPQPSDAAEFIIQEAQAASPDQKLHVAILGPCTNVASAVLMNPNIVPQLAVYYIGFWHHPATRTWNKREFNTNNDPNAVDVLLNLPNLEFHVMTASTSQHLVFEKSEVDQHLKGKGGIADYLVKRWETYDRHWQEEDKEKTKWIMWDVALIEALAYPGHATHQNVLTPYDNRARDIGVYTAIDVDQMKARYWEVLDGFVEK